MKEFRSRSLFVHTVNSDGLFFSKNIKISTFVKSSLKRVTRWHSRKKACILLCEGVQPMGNSILIRKSGLLVFVFINAILIRRHGLRRDWEMLEKNLSGFRWNEYNLIVERVDKRNRLHKNTPESLADEKSETRDLNRRFSFSISLHLCWMCCLPMYENVVSDGCLLAAQRDILLNNDWQWHRNETAPAAAKKEIFPSVRPEQTEKNDFYAQWHTIFLILLFSNSFAKSAWTRRLSTLEPI